MLAQTHAPTNNNVYNNKNNVGLNIHKLLKIILKKPTSPSCQRQENIIKNSIVENYKKGKDYRKFCK